MSEKVTEFKAWLEEHITRHQDKAENPNTSGRLADLHLGGRLAFELALQEFNRLFKDE